MKKYLLNVLLLFMIITPVLIAQVPDGKTERRHSIQMSPLLIISNIGGLPKSSIPISGRNIDEYTYSILAGLEYQYAINDFLCFSVEPRFGIGNDLDYYLNVYGRFYGFGANGLLLDGYSGMEHLLLFSINPGLLLKPLRTGLKGWYLGFYGTMGYKKLSRDEYYVFIQYPKVNANYFLMGLTVGSGYQWVLRKGFTIALGAALGKTWEIGNVNDAYVYKEVENFFPLDFILNFKIGFSF